MATNMDLADKVELDQVVTFPNTRSTWTIIERLSPYPTPKGEAFIPTSNSFNHSYVFRVELTASGEKVVSDAIPKYAIVKMKSSSRKPSDAIDTDLLAEMRALEQLTLNESAHAPRILDAKVELHLTSTRNYDVEERQDERMHFVTYVLMTEAKGVCLKGDIFWTLPEEERRMIRTAFRTATTNIHSNWITFPTPNPKHLIYNPQTSSITFVNFEKALTFNKHAHYHDNQEEHISRTLPTRYQTWNNAWYAGWGLVRDRSINGTDGTVADEEWSKRYKEVVLREPRMSVKDLRGVVVGCGGGRIAENGERREYMVQMEVFGRKQGKKCVLM